MLAEPFARLLKYVCWKSFCFKNTCPNYVLGNECVTSAVSALKLTAEWGHINTEAAHEVPRNDLNLISAGIV